MRCRREEEALALSDSHPPLSPANVYDYLANLFYARRSKINPLWNAVLVGGWDRAKKERWVGRSHYHRNKADRHIFLSLFLSTPIGHSFLGYVDLLGTTYSAPTLATGFGAAIAQPLLREAYEAKMGFDGKGELMTAEEAEKLLDECMKVLFYRDARSLNKVRLSR